MATNSLRTRFYQHRSSLKQSKINTFLYTHFLNPGHRTHHAKVQIIYHFDTHEDATDLLLTVEEFYMRKLTTLLPFGMNDNINSMNINLGHTNFEHLNSANTPFFSFGSDRRKRSHGHKKNNKYKITSESILQLLNSLFDCYEAAKLNDLYVMLKSLSRPTIDDCIKSADECFKDNPHKQISLTKILLAYRSQYIKPLKKEENLHVYWSIPFVHTAMETMGIREIMKNRELSNYMPHVARKFKIRTTFSYGPTVGKKIFNYNKVLKNLDPSDLSNNECDCHQNMLHLFIQHNDTWPCPYRQIGYN